LFVAPKAVYAGAMLDTAAPIEATEAIDASDGASDAPRFRDRLPTLPHDLSEYAREQTGPSSWSAEHDAEALSAWALAAHDDPHLSRMTELLVDVSPCDVPLVAIAVRDAVRVLGHREAFVLASIDGSSTVEMLLDVVDLPAGDVLAIVCDLCARGIVTLDRSQRLLREAC